MEVGKAVPGGETVYFEALPKKDTDYITKMIREKMEGYSPSI